MFCSPDSFQGLFRVEHFVILFVIAKDIIIMLDLARPKLSLPDDSRVTINEYKNPYLSKLTIKILPHYSKIKGATFISPLQNHNNVAIVQSLPLWRNQKFRIGLLWQQNIRNTFNRTHIGFISEYQMARNYHFKTKNLLGSSFLTSNELSKTFAHSGRLITVSGLHSCFFESSSECFQTVGAGICIDNRLSLSVNKRLGAQTALRVNYERPLKHDLFLRARYETEVEKFDESVGEVGLGYYWSKNTSVWLRTAAESDKIEPNIAVELEVRRENKQCFLGSVEFRDHKSIIYLGYKCPSFNLIFPIYGIDSVVPTLIGIGVYLVGYFKRKRQQISKSQNKGTRELKQKNRYDELKLISDKANQNYKREQAHNGLLIQEVYVGEKNLLNRFLAQENKHIKLMRSDNYINQIFDGTVSFRFYVQRSELSLPKGSKLSMIGFFYRLEEGQQAQIYVRYIKNKKEYIKIFKQNDEIQL